MPDHPIVVYWIEDTRFGEVHHYVSAERHTKCLAGSFPHPSGRGWHYTTQKLTDRQYRDIKGGDFNRERFNRSLRGYSAPPNQRAGGPRPRCLLPQPFIGPLTKESHAVQKYMERMSHA